jgi:NAD(P)-dependent dehydrogenase (short-subunit alcohol dehydrogenase family)
VRDESSVQRLADKAVEAFGRLDVWVNNAGVMAMGKFLEIPPDVFRQVMETNFFGYVFGARAALTQFKRQGSGVLINTASVEAKLGAPDATAYSVSKHAVRGFTQALHDELALEKAQGIRVCLVVPANPVHGPELVASTILNLARRPRREVLVRGTAQRAYSRLVERADRQSKARQMALVAAPLLAVIGLSWYLLRWRAI